MSQTCWIGALTDDGEGAEGYRHLLSALLTRDWHVEAAAPSRPWISFGTGAGAERVTSHVDARARYVKTKEHCPVSVYDLSPAIISRIICEKAPVLEPGSARCCIVAGVNHGPNVGAGLIHSGTFCAAFVAFWMGRSAVAISLDDVHSVDEASPGPFRFAQAARIALSAVDWALSRSTAVLCNINVPNMCPAHRETIESARPHGRAVTGSSWRTDIETLRSGHIAVTVFPTGSIEPHQGLSDEAAEGIATLGARQDAAWRREA